MATKKTSPRAWHPTKYGSFTIAWRESGAQFRLVGPGLKATFRHVRFRCTKCGELKPPSKVHFRSPKGVISNEPQCSKCRNEPRPRRVPRK